MDRETKIKVAERIKQQAQKPKPGIPVTNVQTGEKSVILPDTTESIQLAESIQRQTIEGKDGGEHLF